MHRYPPLAVNPQTPTVKPVAIVRVQTLAVSTLISASQTVISMQVARDANSTRINFSSVALHRNTEVCVVMVVLYSVSNYHQI
ncbi:MAG: hypothetical protein KME64_00920 [Scytonematopsis contorta HA4267-MV1]|nr:hypothetical protein [Scytonematopsis contorta HA4267-MV1]